jgi:Ni/Co efflux regulator RcnB
MKRLLCAVSVLAMLAAPAIASAQQNDTQQNRAGERHGHGNAQRPSRPSRPNRPSNERPTIQPVPNRPSRPNERPTIQPVPNRPNRPPNANRPGRPSIQPVPNRPGHRPPHFRPIRGPAFHYPRGYHYRHWSIGLVLPSIFLSNYYFWNDWAALGLYPPPPGYVWVRYGPDLLLVNRHTGRIRDVIYGAFY